MSLLAGSRLGPYEILSPLGAGGMGEVYRARDARLGREVAVKVLPEELSQDVGRLKRFEREARAASALNHPNIVTIYEVGAEAGISFIAMELVGGKTLRELLLAGPVPLKRLLQVATPLAEGLAAAHEAGIVHRDLKPENVMVTKDGVVKILDFGLAKLAAGIGSGEENLPTVSQTEPGGLLGTVSYMSPEQAAGQPADFRSDQFSFGTILYEMATGKKAFHRETAVDTLGAILHDEPEPLSRRAPQTPLPLIWIVERCLTKEPSERYSSTRDLARDLKTIREHVSSPATSSPNMSVPVRSRRWISASGIGLLGAAGLAAAFVVGRQTDPARDAMARTSVRRVTFQRGNLGNGRFAPDGETIVYTATWEGNPSQVYVTSIHAAESRSLGIRDVMLCSISRTGELAILENKAFPGAPKDFLTGTLARVSLNGGAPREVLENAGPADWGPRGDLAVLRFPDGGGSQIEFPVGKKFYETPLFIHQFKVSPDGERIALMEGSAGAVSLVVVNGRGEKRMLLNQTGFARWGSLAWQPSGNEIWFDAEQRKEGKGLFAVSLSGRLRVLMRPFGSLGLEDVSRDGKALLGSENFRLQMLFAGPGDKTERDLSWLDQSEVADLSGDGKLILFNERGEGGGPSEGVYLRRADGSPAVRLGDGSAQALSPDAGSALVLVPQPGKEKHQLVLVPTGPGQPKTIPIGDLAVQRAEFLPDGKRIILWAKEPGHAPSDYLMELPNGRPRRFGPDDPEGGWWGGFSPDGRFVTIMDHRDRQWRIYPVEAGGSGEPQIIPGIEANEGLGRYSADGASVYVGHFGEASARIDRLDLKTGRRTPWKQLAPADLSGVVGVPSFFVTPDGQSYVYNVERVVSDDLYVVDGLK
jgi:Tol biopolymer transport system component